MDPKPSLLSKYKFTIISLFILIIAIIPLILLSQKTQKPVKSGVSVSLPTPTPTIPPITQENVRPTIDATSQQIQTSLQQADTDLNSVNTINTSDDTTVGL